MTIIGEVIGVSDTGTAIAMKLQGNAKIQGKYADMLVCQIQVPASSKNKKSFYLGRKVRVTVEPQ